jgi:hypothetical protein
MRAMNRLASLPELAPGLTPAAPAPSSAQQFPDVELTTHDGLRVHFTIS